MTGVGWLAQASILENRRAQAGVEGGTILSF
jgi:hypothetical protein